MNIQTLKYEIIEWITQTKDSTLLKALKSMKDSEQTGADWFEFLSEADKHSIHRGLADHETGKVLTSGQFWSGHEDEVQCSLVSRI